MTGNVAQVFVTDEDWRLTLGAVRDCVRPGGWLVFGSRRPGVRAWEQWDLPPTPVVLADGATAVVSRTVTQVDLPLVTFVSETVIDGESLRSSSTLRFRDLPELERDLAAEGFEVVEVRDAPSRPGEEYVVLARQASAGL